MRNARVTEELKYLIPKRIGRSWLDGNRLLLLLDGLDGVQADRRAACIRAINAFLEDHGTPGLAVCSRLQEYTAEPVRLKMSGGRVDGPPMSTEYLPESASAVLAASVDKAPN